MSTQKLPHGVLSPRILLAGDASVAGSMTPLLRYFRELVHSFMHPLGGCHPGVNRTHLTTGSQAETLLRCRLAWL